VHQLPACGCRDGAAKRRIVAKLKAARDRKRKETGKCEGRKSYAEAKPDTVALVKELAAQR
jgi:hypothetical protein